MFSLNKVLGVVAVALVGAVFAEQHSIVIDNRCGFGGGSVVQSSTLIYSAPTEYGVYTQSSAISSFLVYLASGSCGGSTNINANGCTVVSGTLSNSGSSVEIAAASPHGFSFPTSFTYINGCSTGDSCSNCTTTGPAFACTAADVSIAVRFC